jgi:hypothetical protein
MFSKFKPFVLLYLFVLLSGCTHEPQIGLIKTTAAKISVTASCSTCPVNPICPVVDEMEVNGGTTYSLCAALPESQGTYTWDQNNCLIWKASPTANQIVQACLLACNGTICDTTFITINPPDSGNSGIPCNPDVIYFEKDVLPILTANCAYSGCHNATSKKDGIILDNYANVIKTGKIKIGNPTKSEIYEVLVETDPKDVMPPPPAQKLTSAQIKIIADWITQGAKNEMCDENPNGCNTTNISFNNFVKPVLASCVGCHKTGNVGGGINLDSYDGIRSAATSGRLYGSLSWANGYKNMPQGGTKLPDCTIRKIKSWIDAGSPQN